MFFFNKTMCSNRLGYTQPHITVYSLLFNKSGQYNIANFIRINLYVDIITNYGEINWIV